MGYIQHHAIAVTSFDAETLFRAHERALALGMLAAGPSPPVINGYRSFTACPDGSKEGLAESDEGDRKRVEFCAWLRAQSYEDGSSALEWAEVAYGSDDESARGPQPEGVPMKSGAGR